MKKNIVTPRVVLGIRKKINKINKKIKHAKINNNGMDLTRSKVKGIPA